MLWLPAFGGHAQEVFREDETLAPDRPEAWALNRVAAASLMTDFGQTGATAAGDWAIALDLGHVPHLDQRQRRVGFDGSKLEDLNKSPVFGRLRLAVGLPAGWVAEVGYTPPLEIDGARAHDLFALSIGKRLLARGRFALSARAFGQHGRIEGDITCPARLAGLVDAAANPYGCEAASRDRVAVAYHGLDLTARWQVEPWAWHATAGTVRTELAVQVDALTHGVRDRSRLSSHDRLAFFALGVTRRLGGRWHAGIEVLHVPLEVEREAGRAESDPLTSLRLQLGYRR